MTFTGCELSLENWFSIFPSKIVTFLAHKERVVMIIAESVYLHESLCQYIRTLPRHCIDTHVPPLATVDCHLINL